MEIFLDSASISDLEHVNKWGVIDGVTTNQKIFLKEKGVDFKERILEISRILDSKPVSVESNGTTVEEIVSDARTYSSLAKNVVPKVPMLGNGVGLEAVKILSEENIPTNVTVMMNLNQLILASKAGATYVSLFYNRARDAGGDPVKIIQEYAKWVKENKLKTKLIAGSIRKPEDVEEIAAAGAHVITIPYEIMLKMPFHEKTEDTIKEFDSAWKEFLDK